MGCDCYIFSQVILMLYVIKASMFTLPCSSIHVELQDTPFSSWSPVLHIWRCNNRGHITNGCRLLWGKINTGLICFWQSDLLTLSFVVQQTEADKKLLAEKGGIPIGIGKNSHIKRAIIDKNARIGDNVMVFHIDILMIKHLLVSVFRFRGKIVILNT